MKMKIEMEFKIIQVYGVSLPVPNWTGYIAIDKSGGIYAYKVKPNRNIRHWTSSYVSTYVGHATDFGNWEKTLIDIREQLRG